MRYGRKRSTRKVITYLILSVVVVIILFPFFWMISTAFKPNTDIIKRPPIFLPTQPTFTHFQKVFAHVQYFRILYNSLFVSGMTTLITMAQAASCFTPVLLTLHLSSSPTAATCSTLQGTDTTSPTRP